MTTKKQVSDSAPKQEMELSQIDDDRVGKNWKPAKFVSQETIGLASTPMNPVMRPCGFRADGQHRKIKDTCLIARMRSLAMLNDKHPKMAVCITMYNEDESELKITLEGVIQNYNAMYMDKSVGMRQEDLVVVLVCDGYEKITEKFKEFATKYKFFDIKYLQDNGYMSQDERTGEWKMKTMQELMKGVPEDQVQKNCLHLFQACTWDFGLEKESLHGRRINFIFALKQRNDGKINSHKWFFQGICKYIKPQYTLMLDIGTRADDYAITKLYKHMSANPDCGGCCGEIEVDLSEYKSLSKYLLRAAQFYEYKLSHSPDKALESFFGYNSVLPGAYCLFRWRAIQKGPMDSFFKLVNSTDEPTCNEANEYLAEDRVMCLQIYIKEDSGFYLTFVPDAKAFTDAPETLLVLMKQRRRWQNGALFAAWRVINNFYKMVRCSNTKHPFYRQVGMLFFMIYYLTNQLFTFTLVGSYYLTILTFFNDLFTKYIHDDDYTIYFGNATLGEYFENGGFAIVFSYFYLGLLMFVVLLSIGGVLDQSMYYFRTIATFLAFVTIGSLVGLGAFLYRQGFYGQYNADKEIDTGCQQWNAKEKDWEYWPLDSKDIPNDEERYHFQILTLCGTIMLSVYFVPIFMRPLDFIYNAKSYMVGMFTYILLLPTFTNILQIYAMCNLHDISWGNRPAASPAGTTGQNAVTTNAAKAKKLENRYKLFRVQFLCFWIFCNGAYAMYVNSLMNQYSSWKNCGDLGYLQWFTIYISGMVIYRVLFATLHICKFKRRARQTTYKPHKTDMTKEVKRLQSTNEGGKKLVERGTTEVLETVAAEEEIVDDQNDLLLASYTKDELEVQKAKIAHKSMYKKLNKQSVYNDNDDDDDQFLEAENEEHKDMRNQDSDTTAFMVSRRVMEKSQRERMSMSVNQEDQARQNPVKKNSRPDDVQPFVENIDADKAHKAAAERKKKI